MENQFDDNIDVYLDAGGGFTVHLEDVRSRSGIDDDIWGQWRLDSEGDRESLRTRLNYDPPDGVLIPRDEVESVLITRDEVVFALVTGGRLVTRRYYI